MRVFTQAGSEPTMAFSERLPGVGVGGGGWGVAAELAGLTASHVNLM